MKQLLIFVAVVFAGIAAVRLWQRHAAAEIAVNIPRIRVQGMLRAMQQDNDEQTATGMWALGKLNLDSLTLGAYYNNFLKFWRESGLGSARDWQVTGVAPAADLGYTDVTVTSGDRSIVLRVVERTPITTVDSGG